MTPVTGIILSGGKSSRMKTDKAFLKLGSKTMIEELISRLEKKFSRLMIIANDRERYMRFGIELVEDIVPDKGPLGGIYTGLVVSKDDYNFIFACDMPFLNQDLIQYMIGEVEGGGYDVIIPEWEGRLQPLCAIYSKECIKPIENELSKNNLKITDFLKYVKVRVLNDKEISKFDLGRPFFANINTPRDLYMLLQ
ncbi:MAG: molybdenum cofactor guanylyltransferase [Candidatus Omnitrophota bacterium]